MVVNGAIDAGMSGEPVWAENETKLQPVFWVKDVLPPTMTQTVAVTTWPTTRRRARTSCAHPRGAARGRRLHHRAPDESAEITARAYNGDPALYKTVFQRFIAIHYWSEGKFDRAAMDRMVEGLQIVGKQKGPVDWSKVIDPEFLPSDLRS